MRHQGARVCRSLSQPRGQAVGIQQEQGEETDPGYIWPAASSLSIGLGEDSLGPSGGWEGRAWQVSSDWFLRPPGRSAAGEEARLRAPAAAFAG